MNVQSRDDRALTPPQSCEYKTVSEAPIMALALYFHPDQNMSAQQYEQCIQQLKKAGAAHPRGRVYHSAFGSPDSLAIFDVWTSQAAFDAFGATLMPILQALGVNPGQPAVMPVHNVIVPPAAKPRPAARKRAPGKRVAKKAPKKAATKSKPRRAKRR
jgi:hypothetical protein